MPPTIEVWYPDGQFTLRGLAGDLFGIYYSRIATKDLGKRANLSVKTFESLNNSRNIALFKRRALSIIRIASSTEDAFLQFPNENFMTNHMRAGFGSQWNIGVMQCGSIGNQKFGV